MPAMLCTLSLHDALPIWRMAGARGRDAPGLAAGRGAAGAAAGRGGRVGEAGRGAHGAAGGGGGGAGGGQAPGSRSEEHTSELQSQSNLVCRLLLEKKISE